MQVINKLTYVCNAGILLELFGKKILIDALCNSVIPIYKNTPVDIKEKIILGISPFDNIDIMLFTHNHEDHFDVKSTIEFLKHNKNTTIISNKEVIKEIKKKITDSKNNNLIILNPSLYSGERVSLKGINVEGISMLHDGKEYSDVENLAYLIEIGGKRVLHVGDAKAIKDNYIYLNYLKEDITLLIAPFPYVGVPTGRRLIERYIKANKIVAVHLPQRELDKYGWIKTTKKSYKRVENQFIKTVFLEEIGDSIEI